MEQCPLCMGKIKVEYRDFRYNADGKEYSVPNIKHLVCQECKEEFFDRDASRLIDDFKEN